ncbi:MAG: hypothetical protein K8S54_03410 [Spirochaetia bacterium]|nr:hypothetical protein [Spirochaetia bacterium]
MLNICTQQRPQEIPKTGRVLRSFGLVVLFLTVAALQADTIYLKNGDTVHGSIIAQDQNSVKLKTSTGEKVFSKALIRRISYDDKTSDDNADKDRLEREKQIKSEELRKEREELERRTKEIEEREKKTKLENEQRQEAASRGGRSAIWRSIVFPGWGQHYRGDKTRGYIFMGGAAFTGLLLFKTRKQYLKARSDYDEASTLSILSAATGSSGMIGGAFLNANEKRNSLQKVAAKGNLFTGLYLGWYFSNVADAFLYGPEHRTAGQLIQKPDVQLSFTFPLK